MPLLMIRLIGLVVSIAIADSVNPSTVGPALYLPSGPQPRRSVIKFAAGVGAVFLLGGAALMLEPGEALLALVPHPGPKARYIAETAVGATMMIAALFLYRNRDRLGHRPKTAKSLPKVRSPTLLGSTIGLVELPTAFPYFAAIAAIVASGLDIGRRVLLLGIYNVCFLLPLILIAATLTFAGDRAQQLLGTARAHLREHWPMLVAVLALLAGAFVTLLGVTGLASGARGSVGHVSRRVRHVISR